MREIERYSETDRRIERGITNLAVTATMFISLLMLRGLMSLK